MAKYEYHPIPPDPGVRLAPKEVDHISGIMTGLFILEVIIFSIILGLFFLKR